MPTSVPAMHVNLTNPAGFEQFVAEAGALTESVEIPEMPPASEELGGPCPMSRRSTASSWPSNTAFCGRDTRRLEHPMISTAPLKTCASPYESFSLMGVRITPSRIGSETAGQFSMVEAVVVPGAGIPRT
ncbi:MAG: hypothetical protein R2849_00650 [Thermomicrobiales bacterium]